MSIIQTLTCLVTGHKSTLYTRAYTNGHIIIHECQRCGLPLSEPVIMHRQASTDAQEADDGR